MINRLKTVSLCGALVALAMAAIVPVASGAGGHVSIVGGSKVATGQYDSVGVLVLGDPPNLTPSDEFNYQADAGLSFCSSTLIAPKVILTAAHCLHAGKEYRNPTVVFGKKSLLDKGPGTRRRVNNIAVNPHYSTKTHYGDIGLGFLSSPVTNVDPMPLGIPGVDADPKFRDVVASAGWGISSFHGLLAKFGFMGPNLKVAWGHAAGTKACQKKESLIGDQMMCMSGPKRFGSVCYGDSGGPLALLDDTGAEASYSSRKLAPQRLIGVNAAVVYKRKGKGCTHTALDVFTSMAPGSPFNSWVRKTLAGRGISL